MTARFHNQVLYESKICYQRCAGLKINGLSRLMLVQKEKGEKGNTFTFPGDLYLLLTESIFRNELLKTVKLIAN